MAYKNGQKLAVKVRHPGVTEQIMTDFRSAHLTQQMLDVFFYAMPGADVADGDTSIMQAAGNFIDSVPGSLCYVCLGAQPKRCVVLTCVCWNQVSGGSMPVHRWSSFRTQS